MAGREKSRGTETGGVQGFTFGIMEGTILLLGLMLGLSVTGNRSLTVLALLVTALADSFANSAGFHVSQETEKRQRKEVWASTVYCFIATFAVMALLVIPLLLFESFSLAVAISTTIAIIILGLLGAFVAARQKQTTWKIALEYIFMGLIAAFLCYLLGEFAGSIIG